MNTQDNKLYKCYKEGCYFRHNHPDGPYLTQSEYDALLSDGKVICPENNLNCGIQELRPEEYPNRKKQQKNNKKFFIIVGIILILLLLIGGFIYSSLNKVERITTNVKTSVEQVTDLTKKADSFFGSNDYENAKKTLIEILSLDPDNQHAKQIISEINKIETESKEPEDDSKEKNSAPTITKTTPPPPTTKTPTTTTQSNSNHTKSLSDGSKYVGEMKNGVLHGFGTYYFKSHQLISKKDLKERYAEAGDYLIGEWYQGNVVNGKLYDGNNNVKEVIIIGR